VKKNPKSTHRKLIVREYSYSKEKYNVTNIRTDRGESKNASGL